MEIKSNEISEITISSNGTSFVTSPRIIFMYLKNVDKSLAYSLTVNSEQFFITL